MPGSLNGYSYAENNPILYTDPNGDCPFCWLLALLAASGALSGCSAKPSNQAIPTASIIAYESDCRNFTNAFANDLSDHAYYVNGDFNYFLNVVNPGGRGDYRLGLRNSFDDDPIIFCWGKEQCDFYDVSVPGNITYGYLGAQLDIPLDILHSIASMGQLSDEIRNRLPNSKLPPGLDWNDIDVFKYGFDSPGDFQAITMGYELWKETGYNVTRDKFMSKLAIFAGSLEKGVPQIEYFSAERYDYSSSGCGKSPPK